jgi:hypothetical protein
MSDLSTPFKKMLISFKTTTLCLPIMFLVCSAGSEQRDHYIIKLILVIAPKKGSTPIWSADAVQYPLSRLG